MNLKNIFPFSAQVKDVSTLIITLIVYAVITIIAGILLGLLGNLWLIGWAFDVVGWLINIYCGVGAIVAILVFIKAV